MPVVAVYDACVLYPASLRDFLLRLAREGVVQPRWSDTILDEVFRNILFNRPALSAPALERTRSLMATAFPYARVEGYEGHISGLHLPDADDRHVLAVAVHAAAPVIVTFNLRDFPASVLDLLGITAVHPDDFVLERIAEGLAPVQSALRRQAEDLKRPPGTVDDVLARLQTCGLPRTVARLHAEKG
ncbi:MAG TPA: PIN domain-containing protein [Myxococcota bacterium]|nr:PIN domain-containing protein [Myxococcota bacterium]